MVVLDENVNASAYDGVVESLAKTYGMQILTRWRNVAHGFVASAPAAAAERLCGDPRVRIVEEDFSIGSVQSGIQVTTWNGYYLWHLDRLDDVDYTPSDSKYRMCPEGRTVSAYVIDGGVYAEHEEFTLGEPPGRVESYGFDSDTNPGYIDGADGCSASGQWHGTAVASVLAGTTVGASKAHVVSLRVLDCTGHGFASWIVNAVDWIGSRTGAAVVSMSTFRGDWMTREPDGSIANLSTIDGAINALVTARRIPFFVSANNFSGDACKFTPARLAYTNANGRTGTVFTVGGTSVGGCDPTLGCDYNDYRWQVWNMDGSIKLGEQSGSNGGQCVSIYAPACDIYAARTSSSTAYAVDSGTSFSAPLAAGVAARYIELTGNSDYQQVYNYLLNVAGSPDKVKHVETPEYWMCLNTSDGTYDPHQTYPGPCPARYIGEGGVVGGEPIHFGATSNTSGAGLLYSPMSCP
jgi:hypothetical protein